MAEQSLLALFAHPDDECFGMGGTLAYYAQRGVSVGLVCTTRGEEGEISDPALATPERLAEVREGELRCAATALGIKELIFLDYRDSGMIGTPPNADPRAYINQPTDEVVARLVEIIRRRRPQVIVTFDPGGGYGHPDHIAIHHHTVAAFHAAAAPSYHPDLGVAWQAERLFYVVIPRSILLAFRDQLAAIGADLGLFANAAEEGRGWPEDQIHVTLDVTNTVEQKWQALNCHRTQFGPAHPFLQLPDEMVKGILTHEHFCLAWPAPAPGFQLPGLFP